MSERPDFLRASGKKHAKTDKPIPSVYPVIDNDLARDNIENDIPTADIQDIGK